ncbi:transporter [Nonomuraea sp. KC401]|uniref:transporter n=1 Tax=unclassified Nonomuraea TaxID=2593643 RepID=UPI0010FEAD8D|nr:MULTISPECIES: transporter [unclassified Nonomuraea]NBE96917.1 transporter [Nonomuraea sp. K271]TLF66316.1 transporter [Nonomuraea sp. KC401]
MIWLTWRQFRTQAATVAAALVVVAAILAITGPHLTGLSSGEANPFLTRVTATDGILYYGSAVLVYLLPAVIGIFWGAPLVTRELELGTHRLVWNQTISRTRWLATKLAIVGLAAIAASGLLSLAVSWWAGPIDAAADASGGDPFPSRVSPLVFGARGIVPIGYAAFAFVLGVTIGLLLRRTVAAMAITLALFAAVQLAVPFTVRSHIIPAAQQTVTIDRTNVESFRADNSGQPQELTVASPSGAWVLSNETIDATGHAVAVLPVWMADCMPPPPGQGRSQPNAPAAQACFAKLADLGYRQRLTYQPADRFWVLQGAETTLFLVLSALLAALCFWWTRHRLT